MIHQFRNGLTRFEIVICISLAVIFLSPIQSARGIGSRMLLIHFSGIISPESNIHVAAIRQTEAGYLLSESSHPELKWQEMASHEQDIELHVTYTTDSLSCVLFCYRTKIFQYQDAVIVRYMNSDGSPRYRLIPFVWQPTQTIELTIPREPPSDAEAWKPPEGTGR